MAHPGHKLTNLGYMNSWSETPEIVVKCNELDHGKKGIKEVDSDYSRCLTTVRCPECGYIYRIDSSD